MRAKNRDSKRPSPSRPNRFAPWLRALAVTFICAWPGAQYGYHRLTHNDPWRLAGFAMYATPQPQLAASFLPQGSARSFPIDRRCHSALTRYLKARLAFGSRGDAQELTACLGTTAQSGPGQLRLVERRFDARSARFRLHDSRFDVAGAGPEP